MVEDVTLRVRVTTVGQKGAMDKLSAQTADSVQKGMDKGLGKSKLPGPLQKFAKQGTAKKDPVSGMYAKLGGGGLGMAAVAGGVAGIAMAGVQGMMGIMSKVFSTLVESSASLRGVLKLLNIGFMQILRPLGDVLAMLLRPVAAFFRAIGKQVRDWMKQRKEALKQEHPDWTNQEIAAQLFSEMPQEYMDVMFSAIARLDWGTIFTNILAPIALTIGQFMNPIAGIIKSFEDIKTRAENLWNTIKPLFTSAEGVANGIYSLAGRLYDAIVAIYNAIAGVANKIPGVHIDLLPTWTELQNMLNSSLLATAARGALNAAGLGTSAVNQAGKRGSIYNVDQMAGGGEMASSGLVYAHKGETIKDSGQIRGMIRDAVAEAVAAMGGGGDTYVLEFPARAIVDALDRRTDTRIDLYHKNSIRARRG